MNVRKERPEDCEAIDAVNQSAFGSAAERRLVRTLREQAAPLISLVAEEDGDIVGHIMFSPTVLDEHPGIRIAGLAPMSVVPERQRRGIGGALVGAGLEACRELGFGAVVVLGHPEYYPRFGFAPASRFGLCSDYDAPDEAFMAVELQPGYLNDTSGRVRYHAAFEDM